MTKINVYTYEGPVVLSGKVIMDKWTAKTTAKTQKKAISNLKWRFKSVFGNLAMPISISRLSLPGKLKNNSETIKGGF